MKKIIFLIGNLESGGVSKSLVSLLWEIDKEKYDISCFVMSPQGIHLDKIPEGINVITDDITKTLLLKFPLCFYELFKAKEYYLAFARLGQFLTSRLSRSLGGLILSRLIRKVEGTYDLAIDYNGQHQLYYMVDSVDAKIKVSFFHNDYSKWDYYYRMDKRYFNHVDHIFSVSHHCVDVLKRYFPQYKTKIGLMENITSLRELDRLKNESPIEDFLDKKLNDGFNLITIGHICERKGSTLALNAAKILKDKNVRFRWFFVGSMSKDKDYSKLVDTLGLRDYIVFLGVRDNPYSIINKCDVVVHPSQFEGKSIALDEAKLLCKPIVVTNFSTVDDQFKHDYNGVICSMDNISLSDSIERVLLDGELRNILSNNLAQDRVSNVNEVDKIYSLL